MFRNPLSFLNNSTTILKKRYETIRFHSFYLYLSQNIGEGLIARDVNCFWLFGRQYPVVLRVISRGAQWEYGVGDLTSLFYMKGTCSAHWVTSSPETYANWKRTRIRRCIEGAGNLACFLQRVWEMRQDDGSQGENMTTGRQGSDYVRKALWVRLAIPWKRKQEWKLF